MSNENEILKKRSPSEVTGKMRILFQKILIMKRKVGNRRNALNLKHSSKHVKYHNFKMELLSDSFKITKRCFLCHSGS